MARALWTYITVAVGLALLMNLAGIPTGSDFILTETGLLDNSVNNSSFYSEILTILLGIGLGTIIIGLFGRVSPEYLIKASVATSTGLLFISVYTGIIMYMNSFEKWLYYPILALLGVLAVGYMWSLIEWVLGGD